MNYDSFKLTSLSFTSFRLEYGLANLTEAYNICVCKQLRFLFTNIIIAVCTNKHVTTYPTITKSNNHKLVLLQHLDNNV